MKFSKSVQKLFDSLESSGYGRRIIGEGSDFDLEGYRIELGGVVLKVFSDEFSIEKDGGVKFYCFYDIVDVVGHLNAEVCSNASASRDSYFSLPLEIELKYGTVNLSVPFLAYSRLLNVLCGLR